MTASSPALTTKIFNATVLVTALGYMVDVYDLILFNVVRMPSLQSIGLSGDALTEAGLYIYNMQLVGLILGGLLWGVMGDKMGRKQCLLGSILTYSLATFGCAFIETVDQYAVLRFVAGIGLAGEVGVGIAMITESMSKENRGLGAAVFAFIGVFGAVLAAIAAELMDWRTCYLVGGVAGLALLVTRALIVESGMFQRVKESTATRGSLMLLFGRWDSFKKYLFCILTGAPLMFAVGIVWALAPEISTALGAVTPAKTTIAVVVGNTALMFGDMAAGLISQRLKRRRRVVKIFVISAGIVIAALMMQRDISVQNYYVFCGLLGLAVGYWVNVITMTAEQFGTNIRATASASAPNFIRGTLLPMNLLFGSLKDQGVLFATSVTAAVVVVVALGALTQLKETFKKDLDYTE